MVTVESANDREGKTASVDGTFHADTLAADSRTVAFWTLVVRATGFGRILALAAVLGPTFFGNLFQTVLIAPYILSELMAGSLFTALLAPRIVHFLDRGERQVADRLVCGFLGVVLPVFAAVAVVGAFAAPGIIWLLTLAVSDPVVRAKQIALGWPLLAMLLPQIVLIGLIGVGIAVQHARKRFALATAASAIENAAMIVLFGIYALVFGIGLDLDSVGWSQILVLGLGSTATVALRAGVQWWGASRLGVRLIPTAGWRDPEVRRIVRMALPSSGSASLGSLSPMVMMVAAGQIPGGAIAFQIGYNFFNLPIALGARPISAAQLPVLSRHMGRSALVEFGNTYTHTLRLALFVVLPAALIFMSMPDVLAAAVSFGRMSSPGAISLVAAAIAGLGIGVIGEAVFVLSVSAAYARLDAATPFQATAIRLLLCVAGVPLALSATSPAEQILFLSLTYSVAAIGAALFLRFRVNHGLPKESDRSLLRWALVNGAIAAAAVIPVAILASGLGRYALTAVDRMAIAGAMLALAGGVYLIIQIFRRSTESSVLFSRAIVAERGAVAEPAAGGSK